MPSQKFYTVQAFMVLVGLGFVSITNTVHADEVFEIPFFTAEEAAADGADDRALTQKRGDTTGTWQAFRIWGITPPKGKPWRWAPMEWNAKEKRWQSDEKLSDQSPSYSKSGIRNRHNEVYFGVLAFRPGQDGVYALSGEAFTDTWSGGKHTTTRIYRTSADRSETELIVSFNRADNLPHSKKFINFGEADELQQIKLTKGEYLVFSFTSNNSTGVLDLFRSDKPVKLTLRDSPEPE